MKTPPQMVWYPIPTALGCFLANYSEVGLARLTFPKSQKAPPAPTISKTATQISKWHRQTTSALIRALAGKPVGALPPLDLAGGTEFQQAVWRAIKSIPVGRTRSYGELALEVGRPKAVRATGGACGANPIPVLIPCHRVLATSGKLGGFSGGLDWKVRLLALEGIVVSR